MAGYSDGFVLVVPKAKLKDYKKIASKAGKVWMDHGALSYCETVLEDSNNAFGKSFLQLAGGKENNDETVVLAWITFKSRHARDKVNAAVMADSRMEKMCPPEGLLDMKRFYYGGFEMLVQK